MRSVTRAFKAGTATSARMTPEKSIAHTLAIISHVVALKKARMRGPFALGVDSARHFDSAAWQRRSVRTESESKDMSVLQWVLEAGAGADGGVGATGAVGAGGGADAGAVPKSTFGAVEIAASLSTAKLGFTV